MNPLTPESVLSALSGRIGAANGITARQLAAELTGRVDASDERHLRQVIEQLRREGQPICAHPHTGYHVAASANELDRTCDYLLARAMTSLSQIGALKRVAIPDLRGQLRMPLLPPCGEPHESHE